MSLEKPVEDSVHQDDEDGHEHAPLISSASKNNEVKVPVSSVRYRHSPRSIKDGGQYSTTSAHTHGINPSVEETIDKVNGLIANLPSTLTSDEMRLLRTRVNHRLDQLVDENITPHMQTQIIDAPITCDSIMKDVWGRVSWLAGLLLLQSCSSFILERFAKLIESHLVVTFFLTMLVGAGGNAGNQSAVMVIRGLATGSVRDDNEYKILWRQLLTGLIMAAILVLFGYLRVVLFGSDAVSAAAISLSLFVIVVVSVIMGTLLPLMLHGLGIDPAHAGPTIQVFMDIVGVWITCVVCSSMFTAFATAAVVTPAATTGIHNPLIPPHNPQGANVLPGTSAPSLAADLPKGTVPEHFMLKKELAIALEKPAALVARTSSGAIIAPVVVRAEVPLSSLNGTEESAEAKPNDKELAETKVNKAVSAKKKKVLEEANKKKSSKSSADSSGSQANSSKDNSSGEQAKAAPAA